MIRRGRTEIAAGPPVRRGPTAAPPALCVLAVLCLCSAAPGQIRVTGISDRDIVPDRATFLVQAASGFEYTADLDGDPVPVGTSVTVTLPDYHELHVSRRALDTGSVESKTVRFIVLASDRGTSERGLPPWVPHPAIDSAPGEFAGASLELVAPAAVPPGMPFPLIARVLDGDGERVGVNATLSIDGGPDLRVLRGVGSVLLDGGSAGETRRIAAGGPIGAERVVTVDAATAWQPAPGSIAGVVDWGEDARIDVTADVTVESGATLRIGAGTVVRLAAGADISVAGTLEIAGTLERPVLLAPARRDRPWGGLLFRSSASRGDLNGAIFTGSGANPNWFREVSGAGSSHRKEQPLLYVSSGARVAAADCFIIDNAGQAGHGESGRLTLTRCVIQRCITAGQYNRGSISLDRCALIGFPAAGAPFEDEDNDALYLTGGAHVVRNSLIGWALDDGIDAGSGSAGSVEVTGCWIESCYHEALAWSESRQATVADTVTLNCGQGIECGFGDPDVSATRCLSTANLVGARLGDNYDWTYDGSLLVTDSLLIFNRRDVWGRAWDDWSVHRSQMEIRSNLLTAADPLFPANDVWDPASDAALLEPFLPSAPGPVGIGLAVHDDGSSPAFLGGVPVRLSRFSAAPVTVEWRVESPAGEIAAGALRFEAGDTVEVIPIDDDTLAAEPVLRISIESPDGAVITGLDEVVIASDVTLVAPGSQWRYLDGGARPASGWRDRGFDDSAWKSGRAELGFGDGDEATVIDGGPSGARVPAVYFRRRFDVADPARFESLRLGVRRDDGAVVYLNGIEVFRTNMPAGPIGPTTFAAGTTSSESKFYAAGVDPALLVAGVNVLAVEVHQANRTSSDLSFDLELAASPVVPPFDGIPRFRRGDANGDRIVDISDAVRILLHLFAGGGAAPGIPCDDAADVDDDGALAVTDAIALLDYLFRSGAAPPEPGPAACGPDPTGDALECAAGRCP